jgi:hypothetical protein
LDALESARALEDFVTGLSGNLMTAGSICYRFAARGQLQDDRLGGAVLSRGRPAQR